MIIVAKGLSQSFSNLYFSRVFMLQPNRMTEKCAAQSHSFERPHFDN